MRPFEERILADLTRAFASEPIHFVGLGAFDFQLSCGGVKRLHAMNSVQFRLADQVYNWSDGPCDIPVWRLINQTVECVELPSPHKLRLGLKSGDYVEVTSTLDPYEDVLIDFGTHDGAQILDIY
ncbi:MAG: hypothetical protein QUV02_01770 [Maricaulis sp.]|uniref:hypothetical protein n=1 Tax=Maricaulis sp. TaxID=1486257 RepID=UPI0026056FED|nr:hypothetical protein [Maricaulis sp.]MDM7983149.1 hypothetical protein [Maricaulis sp.]